MKWASLPRSQQHTVSLINCTRAVSLVGRAPSPARRPLPPLLQRQLP